MTLFKPTSAPVAPSAAGSGGGSAGGSSERGLRGAIPDRMAAERERIAAIRAEQERLEAARERSAVIEVEGEVLDPRGRGGVENGRAANGHAGLKLTGFCPGRKPRGCLFRLTHGWFDLDGFWCVKKHDGTVEVYRGANRDTNRLLSKDQRRILDNKRLRARVAGLR